MTKIEDFDRMGPIFVTVDLNLTSVRIVFNVEPGGPAG